MRTTARRAGDIYVLNGQKAGSTGELFFEDVEGPAENLVGEEGRGFEIAMYALDQGRFTVAAGACGVVRACLERSVAYARERETFGQAIGRYEFVQDMIAKMVLGYETSKLLVMQAAWMKNQGRRNTRQAEHALGYRSLNGRDSEVSPLCSWAPALASVHRAAV